MDYIEKLLIQLLQQKESSGDKIFSLLADLKKQPLGKRSVEFITSMQSLLQSPCFYDDCYKDSL